MKFLVGTLVLALSMFCSVIEARTQQQFVVTGELSAASPVFWQPPEQQFSSVSEDLDWSQVKMLVTRQAVNPPGDVGIIELASGHFEDGSVTVSGQIDEPIDVEIALFSGDTKLSTLDAVVSPGSVVSVVVIEEVAQLEFLGAARSARDHSRKFTVFSDFSSFDGPLEGAVVQITAGEYDATNTLVELEFGRVMLDDGGFIVEAEVDQPRVVNIWVVSPKDYAQVQAVIEPGAEIKLSSHGSSFKGIFATSQNGKHAQLIDAWRQSDEYLMTERAYRIAYDAFHDRALEIKKNVVVDESLEEVHRGLVHTSDEGPHQYQELSRKLSQMRRDFLGNVVANAKDPIDALLALELGAYRGIETDLPIYDTLVNSLDDDLVARRVTLARKPHALFHLARKANDRILTVGKEAVDFILPSFEGEEVWLSELLSKNNYVLVYFWASWCAPCIASFPELNDLHETYTDYGFEIVSITIDHNKEMWSQGTEQHELVWNNLGELGGFGGEVVEAYGVNAVPKIYLLNSQGQIVEKDLSTEQLKNFLVEEYGETT